MNVPAGVALNQAQTQLQLQQNIIKNSAERERDIANTLQETIENAPQPSGGRGSIVDIVV